MKIRKFVAVNIILSLIIVGGLFFLSYIYSNYVNKYSFKFLKLEKNINKELEIINLGTSHTYNGIKYPEDIEGYNFGLPGQKFYYDYQILKKYSNRLEKNAIVIIPISIFSFYDELETEEIDKNYVCFLKRNEVLHLESNEYFLLKYFSVTQPITRIKETIKFIKNLEKNKKLEESFLEKDKEIYSLKEVENDAKNKKIAHLKTKKLKVETEYLKKILKFCKMKKYKVVLITTPFTYLYNKEIDEENYKTKIYDNIKKLEIEMNEKFVYLDYSHDERFLYELKYFRDADHLNKKGAEYFTEILLNDIEKSLKDKENERKI